ncbi:hypothetical protein ONO39_26525, partial [Salmonella enterica subsp. enterica serovar Anatum]|nr:hypothetical protein [Salmonella enterica subsp. enterica serovar Anatum]
EPEIIRNIHEIQQAFAAHKNTKTFFASKTCSVMGVLKAIRDAGTLFYGLVQDGNDMWDATFFCGSCAVIRRKPLDEIGGIAVET